MTLERIEAAIVSAQERRAKIIEDLQIASAQYLALKDRGLEMEKQILGIDGELKALTALKD